jgi:uncharacterized protein (TIGR00369 family)
LDGTLGRINHRFLLSPQGWSGYLDLVLKPLPRTRGCFVCGMENRAGLNLSFQNEGEAVRGSWVPRPEFAGYKDVIHGGLTATVLDEVMTWACAVAARRFCYCAELSVRYLRPVHPGEALTLRAILTSNRRGRIFEASGEVTDAHGQIRASARGKYLAIPAEALSDMAGDFVGDASPFFDAVPPPSDGAGPSRSPES